MCRDTCLVDESLVPENGANSEILACRFLFSIKFTLTVNVCFMVYGMAFFVSQQNTLAHTFVPKLTKAAVGTAR